MVYSGWKFILFLVFGRMTSNFICLTLSTLRSSSLWRIVPIFLSLDIPSNYSIINFKAVYIKHLNVRDKKCKYKRSFPEIFVCKLCTTNQYK